jgi:hypothetical protein
VKTHLAALAKAAQPTNPTQPIKPDPPVNVAKQPPPVATNPPVIVAVGSPQGATRQGTRQGLLATGLLQELPGWSAFHKREAHVVEPAQMSRKTAAQSVLAANASVGVAFEVLAFSVTPGTVPMARARVRVRVVNAGAIVFERVVRTDTIVGDKGISEQDLAGRAAREVLAITNAQLRKVVGGWR